MSKKGKHSYTEAFELMWQEYPKRSPDNPKLMAFKAWNARLKEGVEAELLLSCVKEYALQVRRAGKEGTEHVLHAATFLGPNERYVDYIPKPKYPDQQKDKVLTEVVPPEERVDGRRFIQEIIQKLTGVKAI